MNSELLFSIKRLTVNYAYPNLPSVILLDSVSCDIQKGRLHLLRGENGSGKTSFLRCVVGLQQPDLKFIAMPDSEIVVSGTDLVRQMRVGYIPQFPHEAMVPDLPIIENLFLRSTLLIMQKNSTPLSWFKRMKTVLSMEDFQDRLSAIPMAGQLLNGRRFDSCRTFSGGELQMLNLIALACADIDFLVMDEPTGKLDQNNRILFWNLIAELMGQRKFTVLATTHEESIFTSKAAQHNPLLMKIDSNKIVALQEIIVPNSH